MDTRDKRASVFALALPWLMVGPTPDGSLADAADRLHVFDLYRGIAAAPPAAVVEARFRLTDIPIRSLREAAAFEVRDVPIFRMVEE